MQPRVSIVILNWNGLGDTIECLESIERLRYPELAVILVDNGSEGEDARVLREKYGSRFHVIANKRNYGFAEGNNIGIRYALANQHPDYFLLLNNDTVVDPKFLDELVRVAESDPRIGILGPKIYSYDQPDMISFVGTNIDWWNVGTWPTNEVDVGQFDEPREVEAVIGCALMIRRETIEKIGPLYAGYFAYFEETEWCVRCRRAGYKVVYVPGAKMWHKLQASTGKVEGLYLYYMTRNRFLFMRRNAGRRRLCLYLAHFLLWHFWYMTVFLLVRQKQPEAFRTFCRGTCDGIKAALKVQLQAPDPVPWAECGSELDQASDSFAHGGD